jgi:hypothetical protein
MSVFWAAPYNLVNGDNLIVRINAANVKGYNVSYSPDSATGGGALTVETVPTMCPTPTRNNGSTTITTLAV